MKSVWVKARCRRLKSCSGEICTTLNPLTIILRHVRIDIAVPEIDEEVIDPGGHVGASCQRFGV